MKKLNLFSMMILFVAVAFTSCKDKTTETTTTDVTTSTETPASPDGTAMTNPDGSVATPATPVADGAAPAVPTGPLSTIKFDEETHDWGKIMDGDKMTHVFKFKNTGKEPLIISNAKGSCGCTVPEWPKEAIAPGKSGEIKVVFDSKGKGAVGGKEDTKKVTITANTDPADTYLTIKGKIDKKEEAPAKK